MFLKENDKNISTGLNNKALYKKFKITKLSSFGVSYNCKDSVAIIMETLTVATGHRLLATMETGHELMVTMEGGHGLLITMEGGHELIVSVVVGYK